MSDVRYSQWTAMMAITKASLQAMFRSPSAVVFSLGFPLVFILVFGFVGDRGLSLRVGVDAATDTANYIYQGLNGIKGVKMIKGQTPAEMDEALMKGNLTAVLLITPKKDTGNTHRYDIYLRTSKAAVDKIGVLESMLSEIVHRVDDHFYPRASVATIHTPEILPGRVYRTIDFILPGQLGFSLLSAAVFGTAFLFFSLRQTLVLKRFFATPVKRSYIILGEALSRLVFQLFGSIVIIGLGHFAFGFTLVHGLATFAEMLVLCLFGLIVFMGFGFVVSGIAKNESTIPPIANIVTLPQFLLAGTFFSIDVFPEWLQPFCRILPLTYLNDALRKIAFEGLHIWNVGLELGVLAIWGIVIYAVAVKLFRWE